MGRMVFVLNSEYSNNTDNLDEDSNRPDKHFRRAITAPGTDITALTDRNVYEKMSGTSMSAPIVTGVIAQLLYDFRSDRQFFVKHKVYSEKAFKGIIVKSTFDNARKYGLDGEKLGSRFGQGVIDYQNAYDKIKVEFDAKLDEVEINLRIAELKAQLEEVNRKISEQENNKNRKQKGRSNKK